MHVVVDTNIAFSALASGCGDLALRLHRPGDAIFCAPRFLVVELFKHSGRIIEATHLPEDAVLEALHQLIMAGTKRIEKWAALPPSLVLTSRVSNKCQ